MKRLSVHATFAVASFAVAGAAAWQALSLQQAIQINGRIVAASRLPIAASPPAATASNAASASAAPESAVARDAPREVRLAHATALSRAGAHDAAFKVYSSLLEPGRSDAVSQQAQYNLGNMYLRQALAAGGSSDTRPLVELAKQRYRDLLRVEPQDWDARYNLERALRSAPEEQEATAEETNQPVERRNVALRGMKAGDLP